MLKEDNKRDAELADTLIGHKPESSPPLRRKIPPSLAARYKNIELAGEGAMGTVYRAVDPQLERVIALKLLKSEDPELWCRFITEAKAQARIQHENVCRVYEAGQADGEPYIVMQFIDGQSLLRVAEQLTLEQKLKLIKEVSLAIHEAHQLGLIHRDLKPANILVEQRADGTYKPYVVDFGLVRQVEDHRRTQTGEVIGTPAYMSPEQALGEVRGLDLRTDIWSLGATLYEVIAGRPPFVAEHPWKLLVKVTAEDAPPLSKVKPGVPRDVETIVMKCLERKPARRYDSARELAEDLQRVLAGSLIQAKRVPWSRRAWKLARKHKVLTVLLGMLVLGVLGLVGVWVGAQRHAAEQARLARELGESVKESELFLRTAYGLPLHDVERERELVRARLGEIELRMGEIGRAGKGPGHYALGLGQLALGEPELARKHLEKALAAGYASADLEYALGRALGENLRQALEDTRRITNEKERQQRVARLDKEIREPALRHLRAAVGARIEVPEYAEGLIALYEGRTEEAIAKAQVAFDKAPWMYEAKKLEGDALYAEGSKYRHDAAFDYEKMKRYFDRASAAYQVAVEIGRSDPEVYRAQCELWEKMGWAASTQGVPSEPPFQQAQAACDSAVRAGSKDGRALVQRALVLLARVHVRGRNVPEETIPLMEEALEAAEKGAKVLPLDVMAHYAVAQALYWRTRLMIELGRDASMQEAIAGFQRVLALDPGFSWAVNELGDVYLSEAKKELAAGREATLLLESAIEQYERAMALDSKFLLPAGGRLEALTKRLESELARGKEAQETLQALSRAVVQLEQANPGPWVVTFWKARERRLQGLSEFVLGRDPRPLLEGAIAELQTAAAGPSDNAWLLSELAQCYLLAAEHEERAGLDASLDLKKAREEARKASERSGPDSVIVTMLSANIELAGIRAGARSGEVRDRDFEVAFGYVRPLLSLPRTSSEVYQVAAELHAERAAWLARTSRDPGRELQDGLSWVGKALSENPHNVKALLAKRLLLLTQAHVARTPQARAENLQLARDVFNAVLGENPLVIQENPLIAQEMEHLGIHSQQ